MKSSTLLALTALIVLIVPTVPLAQKTAGQTVSISGGPSWADSYYQNVPELTEVATREHNDPLIKEFAKACNENADALDAATRKTAARASSPSLSRDMRNRGNALVQEGRQQSAWSRRLGGWAESFGNFLKAVDFVSTTAQAAGYLAEGDRTGATSVVLNDISKKTCAGAGAFALSGVPVVGQAAGAAAGEEFHNRNIKPVIEAREDEIRAAQAMNDKLGKPWLPPNLAINPDGKIIQLPPNYYFDPQRGAYQQRSPEQQKAYEDGKRTQYLTGKALTSLEDRALNGEITPEQYGRALDSYRRRDKTKPWKPDLEDNGEETGARSGDSQPEDGNDEGDEGDDGEDGEDGGGQGDEDSGAGGDQGRPPAPEPPKGTGGILDQVTPQRVTASGQTEQDLSAGEFKNIATTKITLVFWNVGGMAEGYGGVRMTSTTTFTMHPAVEKSTCSGFFSGGPNGYFTMNCGGESPSLQMRNGQTITGGGLRLTVQNPGAFANWPKK